MTYRIAYRLNDKATAWWAAAGVTMGARTKSITLERESGEVLASALFDNYRGCDVSLHVERDPAAGWVPPGYFYAVYAYAFLQLGVDRVTAPIPESRLRAIELATRVGFRYETRLARAVRVERVTEDLLIWVLWRDECRVLTARFRRDWLRLERKNAEVH